MLIPMNHPVSTSSHDRRSTICYKNPHVNHIINISTTMKSFTPIFAILSLLTLDLATAIPQDTANAAIGDTDTVSYSSFPSISYIPELTFPQTLNAMASPCRQCDNFYKDCMTVSTVPPKSHILNVRKARDK
jgi:hypothetical protein